jgi:hypothetical protein
MRPDSKRVTTIPTQDAANVSTDMASAQLLILAQTEVERISAIVQIARFKFDNLI